MKFVYLKLKPELIYEMEIYPKFLKKVNRKLLFKLANISSV